MTALTARFSHTADALGSGAEQGQECAGRAWSGLCSSGGWCCREVFLGGERRGGEERVTVWKHERESLRTPDSGVGWEEVGGVLAGNQIAT